MPNSRTREHFRWPTRVAEGVLALVLVGVGWTHGFVYVEGASMEPGLAPGDLLIYRRLNVRPTRGDLLLFEREGSLVVHRVVGVLRDGSVRTKGDANEQLDAVAVPAEDVRGDIVLVVPIGRAARRLAALGD